VKVKKKKCRNPECGKEFTPYKTTDKYCSAHCFFACQEQKESKPRKAIRPVSKKRLEQLAKYRPLRDTYLKEHPICEVHDCDKPSNNLHHKKGREGSLLTDVRFFMACCETCHPKRIHENPEWAYKHGYLISRI